MWSHDVEVHRYVLTRSVVLDITGVVRVLHSFAFPQMALSRFVVRLIGGDLLQTLDVTVDVS